MATALQGVHVALVTPFDDEGNVDSDVLEQLVDDLVQRGVHGVVVNGTTGEFASLTAAERRRNVEVAIDVADGRVPVTAQVGALTAEEAVDHATHARQRGADQVMLVAPYYEHLSEREVEAYVGSVAAVEIPIMLYNNPGATGWSMTPELIARLATIDGVEYLKDSTDDPRRVFRIKELCGDAIQVLQGTDTLALIGFLAGGSAMVWGAANALPDQCVALWQLAVDQQDLAAARAAWEFLYPVNRYLEEAGYVAAVKAATCLRGIDVGAPRLPLLPLPDDGVQALRGLLAQGAEQGA
jgi:4-hydroxy-tetrahydrodipicolinate synthase